MKNCEVCQQPGKVGARFLIVRGSTTYAVHKYCGEKLIAGAPEGEEVRLVHAGEYRREQETTRIQDFWKSKFQKAHNKNGGKDGKEAKDPQSDGAGTASRTVPQKNSAGQNGVYPQGSPQGES